MHDGSSSVASPARKHDLVDELSQYLHRKFGASPPVHEAINTEVSLLATKDKISVSVPQSTT